MADAKVKLGWDNTELASGSQQAARYTKLFADKSIADLERVSRASQNVGKGLGNGGKIQIQQAAFQLQDFVVQVQGGQGVLRAFIQQGSQLAGAFGPWGAVIGLAVAGLGSLYGALSDTGEQSEETKRKLDDLAKSIDATVRSLEKLDSDAAARALANHKQAIEELLGSWEKSRQANEAYFDQVGKSTEALNELQNAQAALAEQQALQNAPAGQEEAIRKQQEADRERLKNAQDLKALELQQQKAQFNKSKAASVADELLPQQLDIRKQLEDAQREKALIRPDALSDQQKLLNEYQKALEEEAKVKANLKGIAVNSALGGGGEVFADNKTVGSESARKRIAELEPQIAAIREAIARGAETYTTAASDAEKRTVDAAKEQAAAADERIATLTKELADIEKQRGEALKAVSDNERALQDLANKVQAKQVTQQAADLERQNKENADIAKEREELQGQLATDLAGKLARVNEEIAKQKDLLNGRTAEQVANDPQANQGQLQQAQRLAELEKQRKELTQDITQEQEKQRAKDAEKQSATDQVQANRLRLAGRKQEAEALEREARKREEIARLEKLGFSPSQAKRGAEINVGAAEADKNAAQREANILLQQELALLRARTPEQTRNAKAMERNLEIAQRAKALMEKYNISQKEAVGIALAESKEKEKLAKEAERQQKLGTTRRYIRGYTQAQGRARDFEGLDGFYTPGLNNRERIQDRREYAYEDPRKREQLRRQLLLKDANAAVAARPEEGGKGGSSTGEKLLQEILQVMQRIDQSVAY